MAKKASAPELRAAFTEHLEVTRTQVERLERIFAGLGVSPNGKKCKAMAGLVEEGKEVIDEDGAPAVLDAALIAAAQRVEHYEMAGYGCVRTFANLLGYADAAALLQETLDEEGEADKKLTELAETVINVEAEDAARGRVGPEVAPVVGQQREPVDGNVDEGGEHRGRGPVRGDASGSMSCAASRSATKPR